MQTPNLSITRSNRFVREFPVFYGWIILFAGTLALIMTSPGQTYAVSIFIEYFIQDLGISRSVVSTLYSVGTLTASFALPFVGRQIDQRGSRVTMTVIAVLFGLVCIYMGFISNAVMLGLGFVALRMLGQGSLSLVSKNVINQWWVLRRGMAIGIAGMAWALLGQGGFPNLINWLIPLYGWRVTYMLLGLMLLVVMAPLGFLFIRNRPEEYGLAPDGVRPRKSEHGVEIEADIEEESWTLAEAMRTPVFWILSAGLASMSMLGTGLIFHIVSIFEDSGLSSTIAASVFMPIAITAAIVNLGSGILVDRMPVRVLLVLALLTEALSLVMAPFLYSIELAFTFGLVVGIKSGLQATINSVVWPQYFGRRYLGSIAGTATTILVASSALGPMPFGIARDLLGNYTVTLTVAAGLPFLLSFANFFFGKPPKRK